MDARIRPVREQDAEAIAAIYRPHVESSAVSFETLPPDRAEMARRIRETGAGYPWLVCELDGRLAGYAYADRHRTRAAYRWSVDTSVYVSAQHQRRGIGRGLYASLLGIVAAQGYLNACAGITLPNPASVALHEAMGFRPLGIYHRVGWKFGAWHDVGWWELALGAHPSDPAEPLDMAALQRRADWNSLLTRGESHIS